MFILAEDFICFFFFFAGKIFLKFAFSFSRDSVILIFLVYPVNEISSMCEYVPLYIGVCASEYVYACVYINAYFVFENVYACVYINAYFKSQINSSKYVKPNI